MALDSEADVLSLDVKDIVVEVDARILGVEASIAHPVDAHLRLIFEEDPQPLIDLIRSAVVLHFICQLVEIGKGPVVIRADEGVRTADGLCVINLKMSGVCLG